MEGIDIVFSFLGLILVFCGLAYGFYRMFLGLSAMGGSALNMNGGGI